MMSQLVLSICQNPEVGSNDNEGMNFPARENKERASFLILCPLYKLPTEDVVQTKGGLASKDQD